MRNLCSFLFLSILGSVLSSPVQSHANDYHNASKPFFGPKATRGDVIQYLRSISGSFTIAGQHNREPNSDPLKWNRVVESITGVSPGLWGGDFLFLPDDVRDRQIMVNEAIKQWQARSLVALTWHVCPPNRPQETCNWDSDGILSSLTDTQWNDVVTDGGILNRAWKARLDTVVPFLKQLKDAGVVPIFRPIHEINEGWSWWGGRPGSNGSRKLYQLTHDYLVQYHGLDNMIWTWCVKDVDMDNIGDYWPGNDYVDVASLDMWMKQYPSNNDYQIMLNLAGNIPIALAEVGSVPSPSVLQQQNRWTWFMVWAEYLKDPSFNSDDSVKATYYLSNVLHQGDIDVGDGGGDDENIAKDKPARANTQVDASNGAGMAVDGNANTAWRSIGTIEQWIIIDLGSTRNVKTVDLYWAAGAYAKGFQIQTSLNDADWTTVHEQYEKQNGNMDHITFSQASARYLKVYMFDAGTFNSYSLQEIEIYL